MHVISSTKQLLHVLAVMLCHLELRSQGSREWFELDGTTMTMGRKLCQSREMG